MNDPRNMFRRISAALLCAVFLLCGTMPAPAEETPATPTDLEEVATSFEQTETVDGIRITVTAEPGVFAADAKLSVVKADDADAARAAEKTLGIEAGDTVIILHRMYCVSGAKINGTARITLEKLGLTDLQAQYPDGEISADVLRVYADKAQKINAEINLSENWTVFTIDGTGVYDLAVTVRLPEREEPAEEEQPAEEPVDTEQPAETAGAEEETAEGQEPAAEEPEADPEEPEPSEEEQEPAAAEEPAEILSTASRETQDSAEPESLPAEEQGVLSETRSASAEPEDRVAAFVTRCYLLVLGRQPEGVGLEAWTELLKAKQLTAAELISGFLNSSEYQSKHKPAEDLVEILYRTMLNRSSDESGRRTWLKVIAEGGSLNKLINGFSQSPEFKALCDSYGIEGGSLDAGESQEPAAYSEKLIAFVTRCYQVALGRDPDSEGLYSWCSALAAKELSFKQAAAGFVFSDEMTSKNLNNEDFVQVLYKLYLDRGADPEGLQSWVSLLNEGKTRQEVNDGFADSAEFGLITASFDPSGAFEPAYTFILTASDSMITVSNGGKVRIQPSPEMAAPDGLTWTSSDSNIFTVTEDGEVFGVYPGQAVLTVTAPDKSEFARLTVVVHANYRAVLFSESTFSGGVIKRNRGDVTLMRNMLASVRGPDGGTYNVFHYDDLAASNVLAKVDDLLVAPSRDGDVSMFFFASHGDYRSTDPTLAGRLFCKNKQTWVTLPELAAKLSLVKGKVIVLLESCGPGAALRELSNASADNDDSAAEEETEEDLFAQEAIQAFAAADPGLRVYRTGTELIVTGKDQGVMGSNLFLTEKFIVMVASGYLQASYSIGTDTSNLFPNKLCKGVGTSGPMPADTECGNGDGMLTVNELFLYVYKYTKHKQTPEVYPKDSDYVLFVR